MRTNNPRPNTCRQSPNQQHKAIAFTDALGTITICEYCSKWLPGVKVAAPANPYQAKVNEHGEYELHVKRD